MLMLLDGTPTLEEIINNANKQKQPKTSVKIVTHPHSKNKMYDPYLLKYMI